MKFVKFLIILFLPVIWAFGVDRLKVEKSNLIQKDLKVQKNDSDSIVKHKVKNASKFRSNMYSFSVGRFEDDVKKFFKIISNQDENIQRQSNMPMDAFHARFFRNNPATSTKLVYANRFGLKHVIANKISKHIQSQELNELDFDYMNNLKSTGTYLADAHEAIVQCSDFLNLPYRMADGTCNNLERNGAWGATLTPMSRLLPPTYEDGIWHPRKFSKSGFKLPNAREISQSLFPEGDRPHPQYNLLVMQFGQFLAHDIMHSSSFIHQNGQSINCCLEDGSGHVPIHELHPTCNPIILHGTDQFYSEFNQKCMNFVRVSVNPDKIHNSIPNAISKVTHYIDGSAIYGSDLETQHELRSFQKGLLRNHMGLNKEMLPLESKSTDCKTSESICFKAGDGRVNQHLTLIILHMIFLREHNRIASSLSVLNPHWSDETIFQEARKIVIAELQHITYNEWLPLIIGMSTLQHYSLLSNSHGYSNDYDKNINPSMTTEFTGAAFRFGHSTVQGTLHLKHKNNQRTEIFLPEVYNNPNFLQSPESYDDLLQTLTAEPMQSVDNSITYGLSRFLFKEKKPYGMDLISLNVQRGRDHGLRPYNDYLRLFGLNSIKSFSQLGPLVGPQLQAFYESPEDIDLYVGGLMEAADPDSAVGPTFKHIIADQFLRLRRGDRYFYDNDLSINPGAFTPQQLIEIKKSTMARIICDNADKLSLSSVSPKAFIQSELMGNQPIDCDSPEIPSLNLLAWKEAVF